MHHSSLFEAKPLELLSHIISEHVQPTPATCLLGSPHFQRCDAGFSLNFKTGGKISFDAFLSEELTLSFLPSTREEGTNRKGKGKDVSLENKGSVAWSRDQ